MNKLIYPILLIIGAMSLTNFVFAQGEEAPRQTPKCQACSSGSPLMSSYMAMMNEIISALGGVTNIDPGAINGQGYNIDTKNSRTKERASNTNTSRLDITNQARGIKSDMTALNKAQERIMSAGNTIINTKFQYNQQVEAKVVSAITTALNKQVGTSKLFIKQGTITSSNYDDLLLSLIQLHQYMSKIPTAESGYSFVRQGYQSNPTTISGLITYYSCAQTILTCNSNTSLLKQTGVSVKGYWADIVRAMKSIGETMNRSYRTTDIKRSGNLVNFGGDLENIGSNIEEQGSIFAGERKQRNKDRKAKRAARKEQEKSQEQEIEDIKGAQAAASKGGEIAIDKTTAQPDVTNNSPKYKQGEISILAAALNSATDVNLLQRVETQRYTVTTDSTIIAYKIPILTRQIYRTVQEAVKQSANAIISVCKEHCANVPGYCGEEIK